MSVAVVGLALTPVKGTRLQQVQELWLDASGVRENRRFYLVDEQGEMLNATRLGQLQTIVSTYSEEQRRLRLELPDGRVVEDQVVLGARVPTQFYGERRSDRLVEGPWTDAFSDVVGKPVRLVEAGEDGGVDRGARGAVSVISRASLERLASEGALDGIDSRRFRMLVEVDGVEAHGEDSWVGRSVSVGEVLVRFEGHVGRCVITSRHPVSGQADVPTLKLLGRYRRKVEATEPLPFGIHGRVLTPGWIRVGDPVALKG
jgi:uncharacterized protein YcbX